MPRWPERITASGWLNMERCLRIGDVVFTPKLIYNPEEFQRFLEIPSFVQNLAILSGNMGDLVPKTEEQDTLVSELRETGFMDYFPPDIPRDEEQIRLFNLVSSFRISYLNFCEGNYFSGMERGRIREPEWINRLPKRIRADVRGSAAVQGFPKEVLHAFPNVPFANISYVILEGGLTENAARAANLWRLQGIFQLAYLTDPVVSETGLEAYARRFEHSALAHAFDTMAICKLIAYNNRHELSHYRQLCLGLSGLLHDDAIPAGRDGTKAIDPEGLCEERNIVEVLKNAKWDIFCRKRKFSTRRIVKPIQGSNGVESTILTIADREAYVSRDASAYLGRHCLGADEEWGEKYMTVYNFSQQHPSACSIWDDVYLSNGEVFFTDPVRLGNFLKLRALMQANLYYNYRGRSYEMTLNNVVVRYLYLRGKLSKKDLLQMNDHDLDNVIENFLGIPYAMGIASSLGDPFVETFKTADEALEREAWLVREEDVLFSVVDDAASKINPSTDLLVKSLVGKIQPFYSAFPEAAREIAEIVRIKKPVFLHYYRNLKISDDAYRTLKKFREQELERRNQVL